MKKILEIIKILMGATIFSLEVIYWIGYFDLPNPDMTPTWFEALMGILLSCALMFVRLSVWQKFLQSLMDVLLSFTKKKSE